MPPTYTWAQLRRLSLARQFPRVRGRGIDALVETLGRVGPVQAQTARSPFVGSAARLPGVTHATVTAAYERGLVVRGSSIRGTVHASTPEQHRLLDPVTRLGQRRLWERTLGLQRLTLDEVHDAVELLAEGDWHPAEVLRDGLADWLAEHDSAEAAASLQDQVGRHFPSGHSALVRRPLRGGWEGQGRAGYRPVREVVPDDDALRAPLLADPPAALAALVRVHLTAYGPATRADIAWWAGVGLRPVDAALATLRPEVTVRPGPDGADYWDLAEGMPRPVGDVGTRLLPEFDAVLVGYHPRSRDRFVSPRDHAVLWNQANGLILPPLLHDGRVVGYWRTDGTGATRRLRAHLFSGAPRPDESDLADPVAALETAMGWAISDLGIQGHDA